MGDPQPGKVSQLNRLAGEGKGAGDHGLGGDDRGARGQDHHGDHGPVRNQGVERVVRLFRPDKQEGALAEIVQNQGRKGDQEPDQLDGPFAEMAHVCIDRLCPGNRQEDRAQDDEAVQPVFEKKTDPVPGKDGGQNLGVVDDLGNAEAGKSAEPEEHDRPEQAAHPGGAPLLQQKQPAEDDDGGWDDIGFEQRGDVLYPFHGAQHRDGRGDHAIAVHQAGGKNAQPHQGPLGGAGLDVFRFDQGGQGQNPAFAFVIGPEDEAEIFDADNEQQSPEDEGQDAEDIAGGSRDGVLAVETFPHRVQRAGADVAENNA